MHWSKASSAKVSRTFRARVIPILAMSVSVSPMTTVWLLDELGVILCKEAAYLGSRADIG